MLWIQCVLALCVFGDGEYGQGGHLPEYETPDDCLDEREIQHMWVASLEGDFYQKFLEFMMNHWTHVWDEYASRRFPNYTYTGYFFTDKQLLGHSLGTWLNHQSDAIYSVTGHGSVFGHCEDIKPEPFSLYEIKDKPFDTDFVLKSVFDRNGGPVYPTDEYNSEFDVLIRAVTDTKYGWKYNDDNVPKMLWLFTTTFGRFADEGYDCTKRLAIPVANTCGPTPEGLMMGNETLPATIPLDGFGSIPFTNDCLVGLTYDDFAVPLDYISTIEQPLAYLCKDGSDTVEDMPESIQKSLDKYMKNTNHIHPTYPLPPNPGDASGNCNEYDHPTKEQFFEIFKNADDAGILVTIFCNPQPTKNNFGVDVCEKWRQLQVEMDKAIGSTFLLVDGSNLEDASDHIDIFHGQLGLHDHFDCVLGYERTIC